MQLREPYKPRAVRSLELWQPPEPAGWRIKVYGIAYAPESPPTPFVEAAKRLAATRLAGATGNHYGVGFLGIHAGRESDFVFIDWWADENELHHHVYTGPSGAPDHLVAAAPADAIACVWDLAVIGFERQAWVDAVLDNPHGSPDTEEYLRRRLHASL